MRLSYRGAHYSYEPTPVDTVDSGVTGRYRGQTVKFAYPRHIPVPQPVHTLTYRGVVYRTTETGGVESIATPTSPRVAAAPVTNPVDQPSPFLQVRRMQMSEFADAHRRNIQRRLQQRIEAAKAKGDENLLHQLEREMQLFA